MRDRSPRRRSRSGRGVARTRWSAVSLLTVALVLTGCSKDPAATTAATAAASSTGATPATPATSPTGATTTESTQSDVVRARSGDFGVVPPEAWAEATDRAGDIAGLDLVLLSSRKVAGFGTNLVVLTSAGDDASAEAEIAKGREQMGAAGRTVSETPDKQVAGATARGFQTAFEQNGVKVVARSYGLARGGKVYLLTLSSAEQEADHAMTELDEILASWTWS
ncbi:hypothetical protein FHX52_3418 [Humibacillus xanthopallidus]|uniref:Lipoprotein LpqN n=1 Tax=Humibacillus xanthopallidus TaxID=412689 RepID=A0A543PRJ1_9MICO|nr:hypothetical protein [Humibacillus xanthopallidus]TQN46689.1 hypothetical protein FHX52_3418 [Humibacillus xanthopallidus]